jgi:RNA polymerase sigma-70 factor (ECF subfamily)
VDSTATDRFDTDRFEASRNRLASLACRLLGLRRRRRERCAGRVPALAGPERQRIKVPGAWLITVVTNLCLDRFGSAHERRARTVGAWLPEPLLDGDPLLGPADTFEQRESVCLAVLTSTERLPPHERAVYLVREASSFSHGEIAEILDITESASR